MRSPNLPRAKDLNVAALSAIFSDRTNSYKFLFFLSILDLLKEREFEGSKPIPLKDIAIRMIVLAWYPGVFFKLSFGRQDGLLNHLTALNLDGAGKSFSFDAAGKQRLIRAVSDRYAYDELLRYVPFRLIRVFFTEELKGMNDSMINKRIMELSRERFDEVRPLYRCDAQAQTLFIHPDWVNYLRINHNIVESWASWEWLSYMLGRNPHVPGLSKKLFPPSERESLARVTGLWREVAKKGALRCIYSGEPIRSFSLDHYVPWSFVAHNQLWNLVPVKIEVNSAKGDRLPADFYLKKLVTAQGDALTILRDHLKPETWSEVSAEYISDLKLESSSDLFDQNTLESAYRRTISPLIEIAASQGFERDWKCSLFKSDETAK